MSTERDRQPPVVHVVLLNYNGGDDTVACLDSLHAVVWPVLRFVVVDNASTDGSVRRIRSAYPRVLLLTSPENRGYAGGNNLGIRWAMEDGAEHILVMNNDVVVHPDFLRPMLSMLEAKAEIGVVTCKVCYFDRPEQVFAGPGRLSAWMCTGMNKGGYLERHTRTDREGIVDFACGVLFLARRAVFETVGLLDERYFMYFEDVEFSRRLRGRFRIGYTPHGLALHKSGGGTAIRNYTSLYNYYHTRNRLLTYARDGRWYRTYVFFFTLMNVVVKTALQSLTFPKHPGSTADRIASLWRGLRDGRRLVLKEAKEVR